MKKILVCVLAICFAGFVLTGCATAAAGAESASTASLMMSTMPFLVILLVMYIVMSSSEKKRKQKAQQMRDSIEVGDKIVTIGGMIGKVVHVTSDRITFETGEDRVRIEVFKSAVSTNEGKGANKETASSDESLMN